MLLPPFIQTDSLIYVHPKNQNCLSTGLMLGELTNEIEGCVMTEWVSAGSKQYAMELIHERDGSIEHVVKMRGITLSHDIVENQGLQYCTFKNKVLDYVKNKYTNPSIVNYSNFLCPNVISGSVFSQRRSKIIRPFICKGITNRHTFEVHEFGFIKE